MIVVEQVTAPSCEHGLITEYQLACIQPADLHRRETSNLSLGELTGRTHIDDTHWDLLTKIEVPKGMIILATLLSTQPDERGDPP